MSSDLIHWTHLLVALSPDDLGAIWSGSVVVDQHDTSGFFDGHAGLVAIFTHCNHRSPPTGPQIQSLAYSVDQGRIWTMYAHNPIIPNPGVADFRDPKVFWHGPSERWVMTVAFNADRVRFYASPNLRDWVWTGEFGMGHGAHDGTWECPDLFPLVVEGEGQPGGVKWILHVSVLHRELPDAHRHDMQYFIGDFDGTTFINDNPADVTLWSDYGRDNYAAVSWSDIPPSDGRRLCIGWMNNWMYAQHIPTDSWQGTMTLPRHLRLERRGAGIHLTQTPVAELTKLRRAVLRYRDEVIIPPRHFHVAGTWEAFEVEVTLRPAAECGIVIQHGSEHHTAISYDAVTSALTVNRAHAVQTTFSPAFAAPHVAPLRLTSDLLTLHLVIDRSSVEVFADRGRVAITSLIFPGATTTGLDVYSIDGELEVRSLAIYPLDLLRGATRECDN